MKKVMVFSDWFAPGYRAGGPIQSLVNLTSHLTEVQFFVVTSDTDHHSTEPYSTVIANTWIEYKPHIRVMYLDKYTEQKGTFEQLIREIEPDGIYLNSLFSPRFTLAPMAVLRSMRWNKPIIVAPRGMLKTSALAEKALKKKVFLTMAKWMGWYKNVRWHVTNAAEKDEVFHHFGNSAEVIIADNLPAAPSSVQPITRKKRDELNLICVARISPEKGIEEALRYLSFKDWNWTLKVDFVGAQQNEAFLVKCHSLANQVSGATIRFLGERTPQELDEMWAYYDFLYLPTRGENFGHAIAESLNHGVPVVISDRTPWKNLSDKGVGWDIPLDAKNFEPVLLQCHRMEENEHKTMSECAYNMALTLLNDPQRMQASRVLFR
jgi:glycosyltransferase involved in cell wall biosynthesis